MKKPNKNILNEVDLGYKESEDVVVDLINAVVKNQGVPKKYKGRGFEELYNSIKPHVSSPAEVYGKKKLSTSNFWRDHTGKSVDTSKTDVKGDRNYSVKYGPAQLMSGSVLEAEATFLVAAEESGLASTAKNLVTEMLEELQTYSGKTVGPDMDVRSIKKFKNKKEIKDAINKKAYALITTAEKSQSALKKTLNDLFNENKKFQSEFIFEAMTGASKFSDSTAIADTMLCINKNATKVKIEVVLSATDSYVKKVVNATKLDVNFKTGSYDLGGKKAGYNFYTALRLGTKDLSDAVNEMNEAIDNSEDNLNESFFDFLKPFIEKIRSSWETLKKVFSIGYQYVKKGFKYILSAFNIVPELSGWQELDTIDLYNVA